MVSLFQFNVPIDKVLPLVTAIAAYGRTAVLKLLALVVGLIMAAMVAGAYWHFNPAILIFPILGFGIYMVGRIGGPLLPPETHFGPSGGYGIYLEQGDFVRPDPDSHSGGHLRDGVDPNEPKGR
jgi:hypothetical protein